MVKTPRTRHSKSQKEPVTIDLDPDQVKREAVDRPDASGETGRQTARPEAQKPAEAKPETAKAEAAAKSTGSDASKGETGTTGWTC